MRLAGCLGLPDARLVIKSVAINDSNSLDGAAHKAALAAILHYLKTHGLRDPIRSSRAPRRAWW